MTEIYGVLWDIGGRMWMLETGRVSFIGSRNLSSVYCPSLMCHMLW
jgi:hypothetical protein